MTEEEISQWATKLIQRYDNVKIVGSGGEWSGNTRQGFAFNPRPISSTEGTPTNTGACCPESGDCFIASQVICEGTGGIYQGDGTPCVPDPCTADTGACCVGGDCSIETESDCTDMGGVFQGVDTTCSPNPCPQPTGACCVGTDCTIETEDDCVGMSGTYQGDGTPCDPNPCEMPPCNGCGFDAFDLSGRKFLTYTRVITGNFSVHSVNECPPPDGFDLTETGSVSATFEQHYESDCSLITDMDVSSSSRDGGIDSGDPCSRSDVGCFCSSSFPFNQCSGFIQENYCNCSVTDGSCTTTDSATIRTTTCDLSDSCSVESFVCSPPANYNCDVSGSYVVTETLSNECIP